MDILKQINKFEIEARPKLKKMKDYYLGRQAILNVANEKMKDRIVTNYARNIVSNTTGYWACKDITYNCTDEQLQAKINEVANSNNDSSHFSSLAQDLSIFGVAYELVYYDDSKQIKYAKLDPTSTFVKWSNDIEPTILYAVYYYDVVDEDNNTTRCVDYYTPDECINYVVQSEQIVPICKTSLYYGIVPINVYYNNEFSTGDFEGVISLIDSYNLMQSLSLLDYTDFADAYLQISGMDIDEKAIETMRENKLLVTAEGGTAQWLVKNTNDGYIENLKNRLVNDIFTTSLTVNMSDENFANNSSGVSIKYKMLNFENRIATTEKYFKRGLQRRWKMICNMLNLLGGNYDYTTITYTFTRNVPADMASLATMTQQLSGIVSQATLLSQLPFISNVDEEILKIEKESNYPSLFYGGVSDDRETKTETAPVLE